MKRKTLLFALALLVMAFILGACGGDEPPPPTPTLEPKAEEPSSPPEVDLKGSVPDGGRVYDKWWNAASIDEPESDQPLWASQSTNERSGSSTWRCKECHGWDYLGAEGAYGSGSHFTGFPGVLGASGLTDAELLAWMDGTNNPDHDFSVLPEWFIGSLVAFLQEGTIDVSPYIDSETKAAVGGDDASGEALYASACASCHGADGRMINFGNDEEPEYVGTIAVDNPWEFIHKVRVGQPGTNMPSSIEDGWSTQDVIDVLTYSQSLPTSAPVPGSTSRGGLLYDKWWKVAEVEEPTEDNPVWARQETNTRGGSTTWRCKECHGWDYMGVEGAYGSGSHFTGFPGVFDAQGKPFDEILAQLSGSTDPEHDFSAMGEDALSDLASFIVEGLVDVSPFIDAETKASIGGDDAKGQELYASACTACHGDDGRVMNFGDDEEPEYVGTIAVDNPWEFIHKVRAGQPGTNMPSAMEGGWSLQDIVNLLSFAQLLPLEAP